jgi:hypothetical protein
MHADTVSRGLKRHNGSSASRNRVSSRLDVPFPWEKRHPREIQSTVYDRMSSVEERCFAFAVDGV